MACKTWWIRLLVFLGLFAVTLEAGAWKPYTHVNLADRAKDEAVANGGVRIRDRVYPLRPELLTALTNHPSYYDAGVIGPDGMPDVTYGQAVIHPVRSGAWLKRILETAYQRRGSVSADDSARELAYTYGFISHGAGDMWGHTLVNYFAQGVFPAITDIFGELLGSVPSNRSFAGLTNAIRHIVVEGYIGDATLGYDGNPNYAPAPTDYGVECQPPLFCDLSDTSTMGIRMNAPHEFVYAALIDPNATLPVNDRGPAINFFLDLRSSLRSAAGDFDPGEEIEGFLRRTANRARQIANEADEVLDICDDVGSPLDVIDIGECIVALAEFGFEVGEELVLEGIDAIVSLFEAAFDATIGQLIKAYFIAWADDISDGLRAWNQLGLCMTRAMFDPQTQRNITNDQCTPLPLQYPSMEACELDVSMFDMVSASCEDFLFDHLLSMLGVPDILVEIADVLNEASDRIQDLMNTFGIPFSPIVQGLAYIDAIVDNFVHYLVQKAFGFDLDAMEQLLESPQALLDVTELPPGTLFELFGIDSPGGIQLFRADDHEVLDGYLGFAGGDHHVFVAPPVPDFPVPALRLTDDAEFQLAVFKAAEDTVMQTRLLLLDATQLNRLSGDVLTEEGIIHSPGLVTTYTDRQLSDGSFVPANVMIDQLAGSDSWFQMMDGDHAWRQDGAPIFGPRPAEQTGGTGQYPLWESCLLRPVFGALFNNWEGSSTAFDSLGDTVGPDPSDPNPPLVTGTALGPSFQSGSTLFFGPGTSFRVTASDAVFTNSQLNTRLRAIPAGGAAEFTLGGGAEFEFSLPDSPEGAYTLEFGAEDPCHTFATGDALTPATEQITYVLDATPPVITITSPPPDTTFDTSDFVLASATAVDSASGVASLTALLDGTTDVPIGGTIDTFLLAPGLHTVVFTAIDNVGNTSQASVTFRVLATARSLIDNLDRARAEGNIPDANLYERLRRVLLQAAEQHDRGNLNAERGLLEGALNLLIAARNSGPACAGNVPPCRIDSGVADLLVASLSALIPNLGQDDLDSDGTTLGVLELLISEFLNGNVSIGAFDALRTSVTNALDEHYRDRHTREQALLQGFIQEIALRLAQGAISADAAARITSAASAVVAAGG